MEDFVLSPEFGASSLISTAVQSVIQFVGREHILGIPYWLVFFVLCGVSSLMGDAISERQRVGMLSGRWPLPPRRPSFDAISDVRVCPGANKSARPGLFKFIAKVYRSVIENEVESICYWYSGELGRLASVMLKLAVASLAILQIASVNSIDQNHVKSISDKLFEKYSVQLISDDPEYGYQRVSEHSRTVRVQTANGETALYDLHIDHCSSSPVLVNPVQSSTPVHKLKTSTQAESDRALRNSECYKDQGYRWTWNMTDR